MEGVKHDCCFVHILEDPFAVLLEAVNSPNVFNFLRFGFMDEFLNELSVSRIWNKHVRSKQIVDKCCHGCIGIMISLDLQFVSTVRVGRSVRIILLVNNFLVWISNSVYNHILAVYSVFSIHLRATCIIWFSANIGDRSE